MNPLKERTTTTTKAITTLFISSVLLVGFMGMSLSLSQTASATVEGGGPPEGSRSEERPTPQCPDDATGFEQGQCTKEPDLVCQDPFKLEGTRCIQVETPVEKCPSGTAEVSGVCCPTDRPFVKENADTGEKRCVRTATANFNSGVAPSAKEKTCNTAQGFKLEDGRCVKEGPKPTPKCDAPFELVGTQCEVRPGRGNA